MAKDNVVDLASTNAAMASDDAKEGMRIYVEDITSKYSALDLGATLKATEDLRAGRVVEYNGK